MKKAWIVGGLIVLALGCGPTESEIEAALEAANYCEKAEDCVVYETQCPFGCFHLVHQDEVGELDALIADYNSPAGFDCDYSCLPPPEILSCSDAKICVADDSQ